MADFGWTPEEAEIANRLRLDGCSHREIAKAVGKKRSTVSSWLKRRNESFSVRGLRWTVDEDVRLVAMYRARVPISELATAFGRTRAATASKIKRMGLADPDVVIANTRKTVEELASEELVAAIIRYEINREKRLCAEDRKAA